MKTTLHSFTLEMKSSVTSYGNRLKGKNMVNLLSVNNRTQNFHLIQLKCICKLFFSLYVDVLKLT